MWEFRNRNVFGATAFSTYGGFWLSLGAFVVLAEATSLGSALKGPDVLNSLAGIVTAACAWYASAAGVVNGMSPEKRGAARRSSAVGPHDCRVTPWVADAAREGGREWPLRR